MNDPEDARTAAWLLTGLRREAARLANKHRNISRHELLILDGAAPGACTKGVALSATVAANIDFMFEAEEAVFIRDALSMLTPGQQAVVTAIILEGFTEQEVAERLAMSQPAVHRMKKRALNRLRKYFSPDGRPANRALTEKKSTKTK